MKKEIKIVNKVKRLLKRLGCPRWLHHYGPKKYEFWQHFVALLIRFFCNLSYRRVAELLNLLGFVCPSKSALQYTAKKLNASFWSRVIKATSGDPYIAALDSTGFSRTNPSYYYLRRIDGKIPKMHVKLSCIFDTWKKKFCTAKVRIIPVHDIKDAKFLLKSIKPKIVVADKGYNAEDLYEFAAEQQILLMIPKKKNAKRGHYRKKMLKHFRERTYHRRSMIESGFASIKRKFGSSVNSKLSSTIKSDIYGRLLCHNIFLFNFIDLGQSQLNHKIY